MNKPQYIATLPKAVTTPILEFCKEIDPDAPAPVYVDVTPFPDSLPNRCYINVDMAIEEGGGVRRRGWLIWELPGIYLCAEHHCVLDRDGRLICVTPAYCGEKKILFLASEKDAEGFGFAVTPKYYVLGDHPLVHLFVVKQRINARLMTNPATRGTPQQLFADEDAARCLDSYNHMLKVRAENRRLKKVREERKRRSR